MKHERYKASAPRGGADARTEKPDRNGYSPTIMGGDGRCALCGKREGFIAYFPQMGEIQRYYNKLDRHEPWGGANRRKSKALGLWVPLCHFGCHMGPGSVHDDAALARRFREKAQRAAMEAYGWSAGDFIRVFGKSEIEEADTVRADRPAPAEDCGFRVLEDAALPF